MPAILLVAPSVEPVTLAMAKAHLRIGHGDEDQLITALIASARRVAEARTGLCFIAQRWLCLFDSAPEDGIIRLPVSPVISVLEVAVFAADDSKAILGADLYETDAASRPARIARKDQVPWPVPGRALNGIGVTVDAGFGATPESVPEPLRQAILLLVGHWYAHRGEDSTGQLPSSVAALLAPYREARL
jgi:uncharacterized phiE125 gp8 family phage protein